MNMKDKIFIALSTFSEYGEAYFSTLKFGEIKGWNMHERMVLNLIVPIGKVIFVIYDIPYSFCYTTF